MSSRTSIDKEIEPLLTAQERTEIEAEGKHYPTRQALCIDALKVIQRHRGHVSDEGVQDVADLLGMTPAEVDGVATFYNLIFRRPVGRHIILICDSVSCWIMGCGRVRDHLCRLLGVSPGETTGDGRFTVLPIVCLGACDHAPVLMVDDDLHQDLTPEKLEGILEGYK
jgi:NADH-quinone oxidoreductase subunit E